MIVKKGKNWEVKSETTGKSFGVFPTEEEAKKRLKQIHFFKNIKASKGGKGSLLSKIRSKRLVKKVKGG